MQGREWGSSRRRLTATAGLTDRTGVNGGPGFGGLIERRRRAVAARNDMIGAQEKGRLLRALLPPALSPAVQPR